MQPLAAYAYILLPQSQSFTDPHSCLYHQSNSSIARPLVCVDEPPEGFFFLRVSLGCAFRFLNIVSCGKLDSDSRIRRNQVQRRSLSEQCSHNPHLLFDGGRPITAVCKLIDIELNVLGLLSFRWA